MKILFKTETAQGVKPKIKDTTFKNHYPDVNQNMAWDELLPYVRQATKLYVLPFIGEALYNKVSEQYLNDSLEDDAIELCEHLQDTIAYYTIYHALPQKAIAIASMGVQQNQGSEGSTRNLSLSELKNLKWNVHLNADSFLDRSLLFLETNEDEYFNDWKTSPAYQLKTSILFRHTSELDEFLNIQNSRRAFISLIPYIKRAEQDYLCPIIGELLYNKFADKDSIEELKDLKNLCQKFIAAMGMVEAIPNLTLVIEGDGFKVISKGDGIEERNGLKHQQHENAILRLLQNAQGNAAKYRNNLIDFLYQNQDNFQDWKDSDFYKSIQDLTDNRIITSGDGAIFL